MLATTAYSASLSKKVAPEMLDKFRIKASLDSFLTSPIILTSTVVLVSPAAIVAIPDVAT